jgi:hypothetical protein
VLVLLLTDRYHHYYYTFGHPPHLTGPPETARTPASPACPNGPLRHRPTETARKQDQWGPPRGHQPAPTTRKTDQWGPGTATDSDRQRPKTGPVGSPPGHQSAPTTRKHTSGAPGQRPTATDSDRKLDQWESPRSPARLNHLKHINVILGQRPTATDSDRQRPKASN